MGGLQKRHEVGQLNSPNENETVDGVFRNKVRIVQARKGYRVSEDAPLLAWFTRLEDNDIILDAGTGNGVIAFCLAKINLTVKSVGLELQAAPILRARKGASINHLEERVFLVRADFRLADRLFRPRSFDVVVSNPPYHEYGRGRINALSEKALSRHQIMMPVTELLRVSSNLLKDGGRISLIYPANGMHLIAKTASDSGFKMSRVLWVYPRVNAKPSLICIEAKQSNVMVDLVESRIELYGPDGLRTEYSEAVFSGSEIVG